jgi:uncharacterized membrane protein
MELSPEERRKIYEEEKARIEAREHLERERRRPAPEATVDIEPNIAGLLCYLGAWITGIIFFVIEKKNNWIRFHAAQAIVLFGSFFIIGLLLGWIPVFGDIVRVVLGITGFILWIVLMVKAYHGERYKVFIAGDIAESMAASTDRSMEYETAPSQETQEETSDTTPESPGKPVAETIADTGEKIGRKIEDFFDRKRTGIITGSAFAIAFSIALIIFFNFFNDYVAYYNADTVNGIIVWSRTSFFTDEISLWLPVLNTALAISILGHIIIIIFAGDILRRIIRFVIDLFALASVLTLISVYPFDFSVIPDKTIAAGVDVGVIVILICIAVGIGISLLVRFIKTLVVIGQRAGQRTGDRE